MKTLKVIFLLVPLFAGCNRGISQTTKSYPREVGDIFFNPQTDDVRFAPCDTSKVIHWYTYHVGYHGNTPAIEEVFGRHFLKKPEYLSYSGYVMVRFVVTCKDEAGMFRTEACDDSFREIDCPDILRNDLIAIVKKLSGWKHAVYQQKDYDAYMCLTFKMNQGNIQQILPLL